jgi:bacterioferritin
MKANPKIIDILNARLSEELTAINQYIVHAEMCGNWRYERLQDAIRKRAIMEMKHAEKIIERILFLEGAPTVSKLNQISIGLEVPMMLQLDHAAEILAIQNYNASIFQARQLGDNATAALFECILADEESHIDWIEAQQNQIAQVGVQIYLEEQIKES